MESRHRLYTFTKIYSKYIRDLKVKCETIKLEDDIGENLDDLWFGDYFLAMTPKVCSLKEKKNKLDFIKKNLPVL